MHRLNVLTILISAALALPGITSCEKSGVEAAGESPLTDAQILSLDAKQFLKEAQRSEILQKAGAEIVMTESTNMDIQQFACQVARERSEDLAKLNALAKLKDFSPPSATEGALQVEAMHRLHGLTGSALDHEFISLMTAEQEQCIRIFDNAQTAADLDIREYASEVLPRLKKDYAKAVDLQANLATDHGPNPHRGSTESVRETHLRHRSLEVTLPFPR
jgi:putative membrane protein